MTDAPRFALYNTATGELIRELPVTTQSFGDGTTTYCLSDPVTSGEDEAIYMLSPGRFEPAPKDFDRGSTVVHTFLGGAPVLPPVLQHIPDALARATWAAAALDEVAGLSKDDASSGSST